MARFWEDKRLDMTKFCDIFSSMCALFVNKHILVKDLYRWEVECCS